MHVPLIRLAEDAEMPNDLAVFEGQLRPLAPRFDEVLAGVMPADRLIQTVLISAERNPALLQCERQSLFMGAMTFAVLGLEVDGATGQAFLVPFNDRRNNRKVAQPIIGYKGYNSLGARAGLTVSGSVVRGGDEFDYDEGSTAFVHHKRKLGGEKDRRIIAAWATACSTARPAIVKILSIDELIAVKAKSPRGSEPPWADLAIGFPAMCEKTAKRRLARDMPLNVFQMAARMEEAFEEQGRHAWVRHDKTVVVDDEVIAPSDPAPTPTMEQLTSPRRPDGPAHANAGGAGLSTEDLAREAAKRGREVLRGFYKAQPQAKRRVLDDMKVELEALIPATVE